MARKEVTELVEFEENDGSFLPITKCVCGHKFRAWDFYIATLEFEVTECPVCGAKLLFDNKIRVFQQMDINDEE
jgi:hypothetical protein